MLDVNNFFTKEFETVDAEITATKIKGDFQNNYIAGQYVRVEESYLNNDVYKITAVTDTEITLDATLLPETTTILLYSLAVPQAFLTLANEIISDGSNKGVQSETVSRYSVNYGDGGSSWKSVYRDSLTRWRKLRY
jgi:hypothetical protein